MTADRAAKLGLAFVGEVLAFIQPLIEASASVDAARKFLKEMGYDPTKADTTALKDALGGMNPSLTDRMSTILDGGPAMLANVGSLLGELKNLNGLPAVTRIIDNPADFFDEIFDRLTYKYLSARAPISMTILEALGVLERAHVKPGDTGGRDVAYTSVRLNWNTLGLFFTDNKQWAEDVYRWGDSAKGFDHAKALINLSNIIKAAQISVIYDQAMTSAEKSQFLTGASNKDARKLRLPFWQNNFTGMRPDDTPEFSNELGVQLAPFGSTSNKADIGFCVAPYAIGATTAKIPISRAVGLELSANMDAAGGAYVTAQPSGVGVKTGGAVNGEFELTAAYKNPEANQPTYIFGEEGQTNMRVDRMLATLGGSISAASGGGKSGDLFIAAGVEGLKADIDVGEDGLLSSVIPEPIAIDAGDILMGFRTGQGVYFEGGSSLSVTVPLDLPLGPVTVYETTLSLDWSEELRGEFLVTADLTLGPLYAYAENIGISGTLTEAPDGDGLIGKYDFGLGFVPPTGYAVSLDAEVLSGGGFLSVGENEYRGALALKFANFGMSAFAILNTQLPGGQKGFSLGASIFADVNIPLAYGFFLTGLGGVIGINRTVDTNALRDVMYEGRMDNLLFPNDPIENAVTILDDMAAILPPREGQHLFGPAARISWGVPQIIDIKLGVVLEVGGDFRLLILGGMGINLPDRDIALVALNLSFFGEIDFTAGTISFDATLEGSRVLTFTVTGDMALRTGWGKGITHIASFGGLHPKYPRPSNLPDLRALSISFGTNNPKLTLSAYHAIAMNAVMFGARADLYAKGPKITFVGQVAAKGYISFDALIYFNPFAFDVTLAGGLSLLVDGKSKASLGFSLNLQGPNTFKINGKVWVKVFGIKVKFNIKKTWGNRQSISNVTVNAVEVLREALENGDGFEPIGSTAAIGGITFAESEDDVVLLDPVGGMRLSQNAVPLDLAIQKIGEGQVTGPKKLDLKISIGGQQQSLTPFKAEFVRSHFFSTSDSQKLGLPSFEEHKAGYEFSADELDLGADKKVEDYVYEIIEIDAFPEEPKLAKINFATLIPSANLTKFATRKTYGTKLRPAASLGVQIARDISLSVEKTGYVAVQDVSNLEKEATKPRKDVVDVIEKSAQVLDTLSVLQADTTKSVRVANDQVSSYIAAAKIKEAV